MHNDRRCEPHSGAWQLGAEHTGEPHRYPSVVGTRKLDCHGVSGPLAPMSRSGPSRPCLKNSFRNASKSDKPEPTFMTRRRHGHGRKRSMGTIKIVGGYPLFFALARCPRTSPA
jgi:hypothetical protein